MTDDVEVTPVLEHRWAVDSSNGRFMYGGSADPTLEALDPPVRQYEVFVPGLSLGQIRVVLSRRPNELTERYDATAKDLIRPATAEEIQDVVDEASRFRAQQSLAADHGLNALLDVMADERATEKQSDPATERSALATKLENALTAKHATIALAALEQQILKG